MHKLGPSLADSYIMMSVGKLLISMQGEMNKQLAVGNLSTLDILHHLTSGFKA